MFAKHARKFHMFSCSGVKTLNPICFSKIQRRTKFHSNNKHTDEELDDDLVYKNFISQYQTKFESLVYISPLQKQQVYVVQPIFENATSNISKPSLQLEESVSLINSIPNWKVADKQIVYAKKRNKFIIQSDLIEYLQNIRDEHFVGSIFISVPRLTGMEMALISKVTGLQHIFDRYSIVLQIFKSRASSKQAKLQVELAEIPYKKTVAANSLDKTFDNESLWKQGETRLEILMRELNSKEHKIKQMTKKMEKLRSTVRQSRRKHFVPCIAVVGYTNAGKTSLIRALTSSEKFNPEDVLFATLDVATTSAILPNGTRYILIDTIGFLSDLPHELIPAFSITLEDTLQADLILHVRDVHHPNSRKQLRDVLRTLSKLNISDKLLENVIEVRNKIDRLPEKYDQNNIEVFHPQKTNLTNKRLFIPCSVCPVSSQTGSGLPELIKEIQDNLMRVTNRKIIRLQFPSSGDHYKWLKERLGTGFQIQGHQDYLLRADVALTSIQLKMFLSAFPDASVVTSST